ncbi:MAG: OsmC family protein [Verrucomicrobiaceae bacterium]|nr:OsmC family protein [Verrucomicrobiaceae bacterium]MDB6118531.1 OsmC family protein [Verrucomicrobiaceae bacterium]
MKRKGKAIWNGNLKTGRGSLHTESKAFFDLPYSFHTRFEQEPGTNPEELIGTAHAGCFSMALSMALGLAGMNPEKIETDATITLERKGDGFVISASHLDVIATIPGADEAEFQAAAEKAKVSCPVSQLLNANITMVARLAPE